MRPWGEPEAGVVDTVEQGVEEAKGRPLRQGDTGRVPVGGWSAPVGTGTWSVVPAAEAAVVLVASLGRSG